MLNKYRGSSSDATTPPSSLNALLIMISFDDFLVLPSKTAVLVVTVTRDGRTDGHDLL